VTEDAIATMVDYDRAEASLAKRQTRVGRRQFIHSVGLVSAGATLAPAGTPQAAQPGAIWPGAVLHTADGLDIPPAADGRKITVKIDSQATPAVRMSMLVEDLPANTAIRVHLHEREDEIIFIRMGQGIATLGDREIPVGPGATIYVPKGVWHGLRNNGPDVLGMNATYSPPGFEQAPIQRLRRPNRTPAEIEADRKKFGIVFRTP
jgi:mannose-6-phosphate isomerase-like protein (cupin superfamily)